MSIIFGILAGIGVPIQTSINARLRKKVGSPYRASLVSFAVSLIFLVLLLLIFARDTITTPATTKTAPKIRNTEIGVFNE